MPINEINRANHSMLGKAVEAALKDVGDKFGVNFSYAGGQYGASAHLKISATVRDAGSGKSSDQIVFEQYAALYGLQATDFGKKFFSNGVGYRITGIQPSRPKFPVTGERLHDKKGFKFPAATVIGGLARETRQAMKAA